MNERKLGDYGPRFTRRFIVASIIALFLALVATFATTSDASAAAAIAGTAGAIPKDQSALGWGVDDANGTFKDTIPISVPALHGIAPQLALTYDSSSSNGVTGVGWHLQGLSRIERASPGKGAPKYDATDVYLLDGEELVPCASGSVSPSCTTGGTHSTKSEDYRRIAIVGAGASSLFTITAKDGTQNVYAPTYAVSAGVFAWGLQKTIDTKNNVVTYSWATNELGGAWDTIDSITYNGTLIKFYYEARADVDHDALGSGALTSVAARIKTIDVTVSGARVRAYKLSYATSGATARSLLSSVQAFGKDATLDGTGTVTGGTSFPATTMTYGVGATTAFTAGNVDTLVNTTTARYVPLDINGDGKTDMLEAYPNSHRAWISNGVSFTLASTQSSNAFFSTSGFFVPGDFNGDGLSDFVEIEPGFLVGTRQIWLSNGTGFTAGAADNVGAPSTTSRFLGMDVNGDGRTDIVEIQAYNARKTWLSTGTGFTLASSDAVTDSSDPSSLYLSMDVNGDGRGDIVEIYPQLFGGATRVIWLSNGAGFAKGAVDAVSSVGPSSGHYVQLDVNGDGKADMIELEPVFGGVQRKTWISTGDGFTLAVTDAAASSAISSGSGNKAYDVATFLAGDLNGDQREDIVEIGPAGFFGTQTRTIWLSNGAGFTKGAQDTSLAPFSKTYTHYLSADVNGDGLSDMFEIYGSWGIGRRLWSIGGAYPDLLASRTNEWGGTTSVSYAPSSAWSNPGNDPPIQHTATAVTINDGRGNGATTSYSYAGLVYDHAQRQNLGFRYAKVTAPCNAGESACPYTETWFRQDNNTATQPSRIDRRSGDGTLLTSTIDEYTTNGATLPWTGLLTGSWDYTFVNGGVNCPGADCKRKYVNHSYNAYGEVSYEVDYRDYDAMTGAKTTSITFVPNTASYIVNRPAAAQTFDGVGTGGALLDETLTYYDGANVWNSAPAAGFPTQSARWLSTPSSFVVTSTQYDGFGNVTATVNPLGARTTFAFDATYHAFQTTVTNALAQTATATWDPLCGVPTLTVNVNNQSTTLRYDALCRLVQKIEPGGRFENHSWVAIGNPAAQYIEIDRPAADGTSNLLWSRSYFDGLNRTWRTAQKGPDATTGDIYIDTAYNARGAVLAKTLPYYWVSGTPTTYAATYVYDALDRQVATTFADGASARKSYGLWSTTEIDELGRAKTDRFDAVGNRIAHDETVGGAIKTTTFVYDARDNLQRSIDPAGNAVSYVTDSLGRKSQTIDPDWGTSTYEYDAASRLTAQTDAKGQRTTFDYDALDRKTKKTTNAGTAQAITVSWNYDEGGAGTYNVGALTTTIDPAGVKTFDYDVAGRVVKTTRAIDGVTYVFQYGYDAGDRVLWTTYPDGDTLGTASAPLTYDSSGRLKAIPGYVAQTLYDASGAITQINNANGTITKRAHSPQRNWITGITTTSGATTIQSLAIARDAKGLVTGLTSPFSNEAWSYTKDELDRLTIATASSGGSANQTLSYDAIGNITSSSRLGTYGYGTRPHAVTAAGGNSYTYDATGLMIAGAGRTMTWDGDNRLAAITSGSIATAFTYDADGARIKAITGATTHVYLSDDYEIVSPGSVVKHISLGGAIVAHKEGTTTLWVHTDHLGSIQAETNASGAQIYRKSYGPYGNILASSGALDYEPRGFTGQRQDDSGLIYLHARYYDPVLGRFISPDPTISGEGTVGLNRYAYADDDPTDKTDIDGLSPEKHRKSFKADPNARYHYNKHPWSKLSAQTIVARRANGFTTLKTNNTDTAQIASRRNADGSVDLRSMHSTHHFLPPPPPPPPARPASARYYYSPSSVPAPGSPPSVAPSGRVYGPYAISVPTDPVSTLVNLGVITAATPEPSSACSGSSWGEVPSAPPGTLEEIGVGVGFAALVVANVLAPEVTVPVEAIAGTAETAVGSYDLGSNVWNAVSDYHDSQIACSSGSR